MIEIKDEDDKPAPPPPAKKTAASKKTAVKDESDSDFDVKAAAAPKRATKKAAVLDDSDDDFEESEDSQAHPSESPVAPESKKTELQGEAPPPPSQPSSLPNGVTHQPQLKSDPGGDAPSDAVRAEGLLDKSEDPLKATA